VSRNREGYAAGPRTGDIAGNAPFYLGSKLRDTSLPLAAEGAIQAAVD